MQKEFLGKNGLVRFLAKLFETFSEVGHTHSKSDIRDFPTIPTKTSQLTNDSGFKTTDNNTTYTLTKSGSVITLTGTDGSSMSVDDSDTKITVDSTLSSSSTNPVQNKVINSAIEGAKAYADSAVSKIKNDLLNGAGTAYDTLKELGDLIDDNNDAIEALEHIASGKSDQGHEHAISDVSGLQAALDGKANSSHGTHVSYSTTAPVMDGTASAGSATTVSRSDHKHPTDTSRAAKTDLDSHTGNTTSHITSTERTNWNAAKTHADSAHAPAAAEVNQNAFSNIAIGSTTIAADTKTDTLTLAGNNVTITPDATNDKVTIGITKDNVVAALGYTPPTTNTVYTHPTTSGNKHIPSGGSSGQILRWSADGTAVWGNDNNTTYSAATTSSNGLMTSTMVSKLDSIAEGANKTTVDSSLSTTSTNPVQNKVITAEFDKCITVDVTNANEAEPNSINADTLGGYSADEYIRKDQYAIELNYSVVNGLEEPANPTQNMIWVQTVTPIGRVFFGNDEPNETFMEGDVWICTGNSSGVAFNSLKVGNNYMDMVYPLNVLQYVNDEWANVTAMSYQNGEWAEWIIYLFNYGKQYYTWSAVGKRASSTSNNQEKAPAVAMNADGSVTLTMTGGTSSMQNRGGYICNTPIDLTNIETLTLKCTVTADAYYEIGIYVLRIGELYYNSDVTRKLITGTGANSEVKELVADVSKLNKEYDIFIGTYAEAGKTMTVVVTEVFGE